MTTEGEGERDVRASYEGSEGFIQTCSVLNRCYQRTEPQCSEKGPLFKGTRKFRRQTFCRPNISLTDVSPTDISPTDISPTTRTFRRQDISPTDHWPTDNSPTDDSLSEIIPIEIIQPSTIW